MTPQEKAKEFFNKMNDLKETDLAWVPYDLVQQYCTIAVDEIISAIDWHEFETPNKQIEYWQQVKIEINKL